MLKRWVGILKSQRGAGLAEYGLLIALIAVVCIVAITAVGKAIAGKFHQVGDEIQNAQPQ